MSEYINKQEAIEAFSDMSDGIPITHGDMISDTTAVNVIKSIPSADVRPNIHGHWEVVSDGYGDNAYICECSECKDTVWVYKDADRKWNYCPNCGADMRGE